MGPCVRRDDTYCDAFADSVFQTACSGVVARLDRAIPETVRACTRRHGVLDAPLEAGHDDRGTRLRDLAARYARVLPVNYRPLQSEGAGNAGRPMRPIAAC